MYRVIEPPFTLMFDQMSRRELKSYFLWFLGVMPERFSILELAVNETSSGPRWRADFTAASLDGLGEWFRRQVERQPKSDAEMKAELALRPPFPIPEHRLTNRTISACFDVGMYLAETLRARYPRLVWRQVLGGKRNVDYGQPTLIGLSRVPWNPVNAALVIAARMADGELSASALREAYDFWCNRVAEGEEPPSSE
jgi:hypothetical protein